MKRLFLLLSAVLLMQFARGQGFSKAEYFFDTDPGVNNGTSITLTGTSDTINFSTAISIASLPSGFHFLGLRVRDNNGTWGLFEKRGFYISSTTTNAANISAAEYFFDTDPGAGNGTATAVGTTGSVVNFTATIPTSLPAGFHFLAIRTKDANGIWGFFETRGFFISSSTADAANIVAAEYFFDTDPGAGNGTATAVGTTGSVVNFTATIPTSLPAGFHFLAIRIKDANGVWGLFETRGFFISSSTSDAANIVAAEYFFDTDPGMGNGTATPVGTSGSVVNFAATIPTSLSAGFHFLAIRIKGQDGIWGLFEKRGFYISNSTTDAANIVAAEYFLDTDPGIGNGIATPVGTAGSVVNFTATIPTSLPAGFHFLAIRVKGQDDIWGLFEKRGFYISSTTADAANIVAAEYFFDADPGPGNGTAVSVGVAGSIVNFTATIPASLSTGFHFLTIRVKGVDGVWGLFEKRGFYISTTTADMPVITAAEYFFDADPGISNGTPLTITTPGNIVTQTFIIPAGTLPLGQHFLSIRVRDQAGNWGLYDFDTLNVGNSTINCPANTIVNTGIGQCTAVVNGIDPVINPVQSFTYTLSGATTGSGSGTASGRVFNTGVTTVAYVLTGSPTVNCSFTVTVNAVPPAITNQPTGQAVCTGTNVTFNVAATGSGLTYQWRKGGINISGATSASFTITGAVVSDAGNYDVVISTPCGTNATSATATLTVNTTSLITSQPADQTVCAGNNVTFSVTASGSGLTFQWRKSGINITGATNSSFTIIGAGTGDAGNYDVVINSICGPGITSNTAILTVNTAPSITSQPTNQTVCAGNNVTFSVAATGTALVYQWRKGGANIGGAASSTFTIIGVVPGDAGNYDVVVSGACPPAATSNTVSLTVNTAPVITAQPVSQTVCTGTNVTFSVAATGTGLTFQWRNGGVNISGATTSSFTINNVTTANAGNYDVVVSGICAPVATSNTVALTVNTAPFITSQPSSQTTCAGGNITFNVTATGTGLSYQWRKNGINISGATNSSFNINGVVAGDAGNYDVVVSGACPAPAISNPVTLTVNTAPAITVQPVSQSVCAGINVTFSVTASGSGLTFQWRKGGVNITGATNNSFTINGVVATDAGNYDVVVSGICTPPVTSSTATLTVNAVTAIGTQPLSQTICAGSNVTFSVTATGTLLTYQWRKGGVNINGATASSFTINGAITADAGSYDVIVSGTCGTVTSGIAILTVNAATAISTQPASQVVCAGTNITFSVAATGSNLSFQWRKGGVNISGAVSSSFIINNVVPGDAGSYDVIITGSCGILVSNTATLTINPITAINTQPVSQTTCAGSNITFTVSATGTALTFQWRKGGINITGATSSSFTLTSTATTDAGNYDVVVSGTCGTLTSSVAILTVNAAGTWLGITSTDWNTPSNWCGGIPVSTTDVIIPSLAPNMPGLAGGNGTARNITINAGGSLTISAGGTLDLLGSIINNGTFNAAAGNINFLGVINQSMPAFTATNVTVNGSGGVLLNGNAAINGTLTLTNGSITLGTNSLALAASSTGSVASHIVTNGSGSVIVKAFAAFNTRTVPVAANATSYNPVVIAANTGHVTDDITVKMIQGVFLNGSSGTLFTDKSVDKTWIIDEAVAGGSNVNITLQWGASQELIRFDRNKCYVTQNIGGAWLTGDATAANGTDPFTQTKNNVTVFSPFALQTQPLPRPVSGIYPNPVATVLNIVTELPAADQATIFIYDAAGRLVMQQAAVISSGISQTSINVEKLSGGVYTLIITGTNISKIWLAKFVKE
ncbi:MAG: T9SS type A sorting domain-containing protein [Bacteroidota bacterium]|nr:T9SS type A sorting domain-containing protein [Bacteroidota bacterium]